ncbi:MAG: hypothetical protein PHG02_02400 [Oscillospiraceae bacterium]|nr:hypothetical protein [Oscillospiraceae bacterium]
MDYKAPLTYKGRPLVRSKNELYYGSLSEPYVIFMQILTTKVEENEEIADRVHVTLLKTDTKLSLLERVVKQSDKNGLWSALDIGNIWLERALTDVSEKSV